MKPTNLLKALRLNSLFKSTVENPDIDFWRNVSAEDAEGLRASVLQAHAPWKQLLVWAPRCYLLVGVLLSGAGLLAMYLGDPSVFMNQPGGVAAFGACLFVAGVLLAFMLRHLVFGLLAHDVEWLETYTRLLSESDVLGACTEAKALVGDSPACAAYRDVVVSNNRPLRYVDLQAMRLLQRQEKRNGRDAAERRACAELHGIAA